MSVSMPKGKELEFAKYLYAMSGIPEIVETDLDSGPSSARFTIACRQVLHGVRANGVQRPVTAILAMGRLREFVEEVKAQAARAEQACVTAVVMLVEVEQDFKELNICPQCKGSGGWETSTKGEDCQECEGRGCVE